MKNQRFLFAIGLILVAGLLIYAVGTGAGKAQKKSTGSSGALSEKSAPVPR